jgi:hypothetical protein
MQPQTKVHGLVDPMQKKSGRGKALAISLGILIPVAALVVLGIWFGPLLFTSTTSASVDASGSIIKAEGIEVVFGSGAVDTAVNIEVTARKPAEDAKPDGLLSSLYVLDADVSLEKPVTVRVKLPEDAAAENLKIGLGAEHADDDGKNMTVHYSYIEAKIADGYAEAEITPADYAAEAALHVPREGVAYAAAKRDMRVYVGIFECAAYFKDGGHFKIFYPGSANFKAAEALLTDLESAYKAFLDRGYEYGKRTKWPFEVNVINMTDLGGYVENGLKNLVSGRSPDHGCIELNKSLFVGGYQSGSMRPLVGHEWFHFVQANYETGGTDSPWFDDATATWYEGWIQKATPSIVNQYYLQAFNGVIPQEDNAHEGYARAPQISFLEKKFGSGFMLRTLKGFANGTPAKDAFIAATGDPSTWAADCYEYMVSGKSGSMVPYTAYKNLTEGDNEYLHIGANMELKTPSEDEIKKACEEGKPVQLDKGVITVPAYGARLLAVTAGDGLGDILSEGMKLQFATGNEADIRLFSITGTNNTVLKASDHMISVESIKNDLEKGVQYLILITNLQNAQASISLTAELVMYPTLDELVGVFNDGKITITEVFISKELRDKAAAQAAAETSDGTEQIGCDQQIIDAMDKMKGKSVPSKFRIEKTGENAGKLVITGDEGKKTEMPFIYEAGVLTFEYSPPASEETNGYETLLKGEIHASYGNNKDVKINGTLRYLVPQKKDDFYMDYMITGSHAIPKVNP